MRTKFQATYQKIFQKGTQIMLDDLTTHILFNQIYTAQDKQNVY